MFYMAKKIGVNHPVTSQPSSTIHISLSSLCFMTFLSFSLNCDHSPRPISVSLSELFMFAFKSLALALALPWKAWLNFEFDLII